jgi:hypothetical protein
MLDTLNAYTYYPEATHVSTETLTAKPGDIIELAVDHDGMRAGTRLFIDGSYFGMDFDDGKGPLCLAIRSMTGSAYREGDHVSVSGGPCPFVPLSALVPAGEVDATFWRFRNGIRRAHNGEDYTLTVPRFLWSPAGR